MIGKKTPVLTVSHLFHFLPAPISFYINQTYIGFDVYISSAQANNAEVPYFYMLFLLNWTNFTRNSYEYPNPPKFKIMAKNSRKKGQKLVSFLSLWWELRLKIRNCSDQ